MKSEQRVDAAVIEACQQGNREALRQLFEVYKDRVYSIALYFFSSDHATAKDVTQQVFLKLLTRMEQFRNDSEFSTWLYRVVANTCLDERRKQRRVLLFGDDEAMDVLQERKSLHTLAERREVAEAVQRAVGKLKPKLRMAILLKYFEELSYEEMAEVLGCSVGTVASRLNRGHKILARQLAHWRGVLLTGE